MVEVFADAFYEKSARRGFFRQDFLDNIMLMREDSLLLFAFVPLSCYLVALEFVFVSPGVVHMRDEGFCFPWI